MQAPPNLVDPSECRALLARRHRRLGRRLAADARPRQPRAPLARRSSELRRAGRAEPGFALTERLTAHPRVRPGAAASRGSTRGCARTSPRSPTRRPAWPARTPAPTGLPWQEPDGGLAAQVAPAAPTCTAPSTPRAAPTTAAATSTRSTATGHEVARAASTGARAPQRLDADVRGGAAVAPQDDPAGLLATSDALALFTADGADLDARGRARRRRCAGTPSATTSPTSSTATSTSPTSATSAAGSARSPSARPTPTPTRSRWTRSPTGPRRRWTLGATEVCMQGGIDPELPGTAYSDLVRAVKAAVPGHARARVLARWRSSNGVGQGRAVDPRTWLDRGSRTPGSDTIPGTAAEILDDEVRWVLTKGKLPGRARGSRSSPPRTSSASRRSSHDDVRPRRPPAALGRPPAHARRASRTETGGFTEFVPLPFVHTNAPIYLAGVARPGPDAARQPRRARDGPAPAARPDRQHPDAPGSSSASTAPRAMLSGGANDLGGTLMEETICRMAGSEHGSAKTVAELTEIARRHRPPGPRSARRRTARPCTSRSFSRLVSGAARAHRQGWPDESDRALSVCVGGDGADALRRSAFRLWIDLPPRSNTCTMDAWWGPVGMSSRRSWRWCVAG